MLSHWIGTTIQIRPEIRFDHAWDRKSYHKGKRKSQLTVASDFISNGTTLKGTGYLAAASLSPYFCY